MKSPSDVGGPASLGAHRVANHCSEIVVADIDRQRRPVGVDERHSATRAHHTRHFGDGSYWIGQPLQGSFGSHDVEGIVRLGERTGVANSETHPTRCDAHLRSGDAHHLRRDVDTDDLAISTEIVSQGERCLAEPTAHVEQPLSATETQLAALPRAQPARRLPLRGGVHRGEEHRYVRIVIDQLVAEAVRVIDGHTPKLRLSPRLDVH